MARESRCARRGADVSGATATAESGRSICAGRAATRVRARASVDSADVAADRDESARRSRATVSGRSAVPARSRAAARVACRGISTKTKRATTKTAALTPTMRSGRRSAFRALAASHCVIIAADRIGGGCSGSAPRTALSVQHAAPRRRIVTGVRSGIPESGPSTTER